MAGDRYVAELRNATRKKQELARCVLGQRRMRMPFIIKNLTSSPLYVPLSSGRSLRISGRAASGAVADIEVKNNPKVEKLLGQRAIAVEPHTEHAGETAKEAGAEGEMADKTARVRKKN
jgi:hypothetical protein